MVNASAKHNGLSGLAKQPVGLLDPLGHNVARDLHAALGHLILGPLTGHLGDARHVDLFGDEDAQWCQPAILDQVASGLGTHNVRVQVAQSLGEWRGRQPDDLHAWVCLDHVDRAFALNVALVNDQKINVQFVLAPLQSLCAADLDALVWPVTPMPRHHDAMVNFVA